MADQRLPNVPKVSNAANPIAARDICRRKGSDLDKKDDNRSKEIERNQGASQEPKRNRERHNLLRDFVCRL